MLSSNSLVSSNKKKSRNRTEIDERLLEHATGAGSVRSLLKSARGQLNSSPTPSLDAEVLLAHVLGCSRAWVLAHSDVETPAESRRQYRELVNRRSQGEPVAYLRGLVEWYELVLEVTPDVLIPRPETELLVEAALAEARRRDASIIADVGTGCGAISIALALELPGAQVYATDVSGAALSVARRNAERHGVENRVRFKQGDLLAPVGARPDLVVANLPYLPDAAMQGLPAGVRFEPALALRGGVNGTDCYERLWRQVHGRDWRVPMVLEIDATQGELIPELVRSTWPASVCRILPDYAGLSRIAVIEPESGG